MSSIAKLLIGLVTSLIFYLHLRTNDQRYLWMVLFVPKLLATPSLSACTGLVKWMETEQNPGEIRWCPFSLRLPFGVSISCLLMFGKYVRQIFNMLKTCNGSHWTEIYGFSPVWIHFVYFVRYPSITLHYMSVLFSDIVWLM